MGKKINLRRIPAWVMTIVLIVLLSAAALAGDEDSDPADDIAGDEAICETYTEVLAAAEEPSEFGENEPELLALDEHSEWDENGCCVDCGEKICYIASGFCVTEDGRKLTAEVKDSLPARFGSEASLDAPLIAGYNFIGWFLTDEAGNAVGESIGASRHCVFTCDADTMLAAVYRKIGSAELTINGGSNFSINGVKKTNEVVRTYPLGSRLTVVCNVEGFEYWKNSAGQIVSREASYTFTVSGRETVSAVINRVTGEQATVVFESRYGQVMARNQYTAGGIMSREPVLPFLYGYDAIGWDYNGDGEYDAGDTFAAALARAFENENNRVTILPVYRLRSKTYTITVVNGSGSGEYEQNAIVTLKAAAAGPGEKFSHWEDSRGRILSYKESYKFYASEDAVITAVYVTDTAAVEAVGTTEIVSVVKDEVGKKLTFVSMSTVPDGCAIVKAGVIATSNEAIANGTFNDTTAAYVRGSAWDGSTYRYSWTKGSVNAGDTWYVRAYLVYTDAEGNTHTVYGSMVSETM